MRLNQILYIKGLFGMIELPFLLSQRQNRALALATVFQAAQAHPYDRYFWATEHRR